MRSLKALLASIAVLGTPACASDRAGHLTYRIQHEFWGEIGTLEQDILSNGAETKVTTKLDVHVSLLGFTLHDGHGVWHEVWSGGRLQIFQAKTMADGAVETTAGRREGGTFIIRANGKEILAPADVQPIVPWSTQFLHASTFMSPETGRLIPASIRDEGIAAKTVPGAMGRLHHYVVNVDGEHHVYFDEVGTMVQLEFADITGRATITLARPMTATMVASR